MPREFTIPVRNVACKSQVKSKYRRLRQANLSHTRLRRGAAKQRRSPPPPCAAAAATSFIMEKEIILLGSYTVQVGWVR